MPFVLDKLAISSARRRNRRSHLALAIGVANMGVHTMKRRLAYCGAPVAMINVISYLVGLGTTQRDLHMVELFSGEAALSCGFQEKGMRCEQLDIRRNALDDIRKVSGFLRACQLVMRLEVGGLLWSGNPCNTWVWISRSSTGRSRGNPLGRTDQACVSEANTTASRVALLVLLAVCRGACWAIEQPGSSLLPEHPRMQMLAHLGRILNLHHQPV